jgi:hypothetical protein
MALRKKVNHPTTGVKEYARLLGLDTAPMNLASKIFALEISMDEDSRNEVESHPFKRKRNYKEVNLANAWQLELGLDTTVAEVITEAYRALKVAYPEYSTEWDDVL